MEMSEKLASVKRVLSPDEWKKRQLDTLKDVGERNYKVGIATPKRDPIAAGIAAEEKYAAEVKKAIEEERRKKALEKTDMASWYKYSSELGAGRLVDGVTKREAKVTKFITNFQPILTSHLATIDAMPDVTDKDREDRVIANLRGLKALKGKA